MERNTVLCVLAVVCALLSTSPAARAEWTSDGVLVTTSTINEGDWRRMQFGMAADGRGGAILYWQEFRGETGYDIFAQRLDARGRLLWPRGGIALCAAAGDQGYPRLLPDGSGSFILLWNDRRGGNEAIYGQRIDADGNPLWEVDGVPILPDSGCTEIASAISNEAGGIILFYYHYSDDYSAYTTDAVLIDSDANVLWTAGDVIPSNTSGFQLAPGLTSDGAGGAIIAWRDYISASNNMVDIRLQRLDSTGRLRWGTKGILIAEDIYFICSVLIQSDGSGGAMVVWEDQRNGTSTVRAQRVLSNGMRYWSDGGVPVTASADYQDLPRFISDGSGGVIIIWSTRLGHSDIFAQRVDGNGTILWAVDGVPVCDTPNEQQIPTIISDGAGGAIVVWTDYPRVNPWVADIHAQHITGDGLSLWASEGLTVCAAPGQQAYTRCLPDGEGGVIVAWEDSRSGQLSAYVQRIDRNGYWGYPAPSIEAVRDVPGDQGGFANLSWLASRLDAWPGHAISSYSVWRAISPERAAHLLKSGGALLADVAGFAAGASKELVREERAGARTYYWKLVSTVPAAHLDGYAEVVPTLFDSTAVCAAYHYFQVIGHGIDPGAYWISEPDSGRSVDNLAPAPPANLAGAPASEGTGLQLIWNRCCETDLDHYEVYRGPTEGFEPARENRIASLADTMHTDGGWRAGDHYYYKVAAVDVHGNASGFALLCPEDISDGESDEMPAATFLSQNFPNPFNPSTKIVFGLRQPEFVTLRIYNAAGHLVRVLIDRDLAAGTYDAVWDGRDDRGAALSSGVYFCRLKAGSFTSLKKMVLLR